MPASTNQFPCGDAVGSSRVLVIGNFGSGNIGNEATLSAALKLIKHLAPAAKPVIVCPDPERATLLHAVPAIPIGPSFPRGPLFRFVNRLFLRLPVLLREIFRAIALSRNAAFVLMPGTGILADQGQPPLGLPLQIAIWLSAAKLTATPIHIVGVGAGPIGHPLSRILIRWAASLADSRTFRDSNSRTFMCSIGLRCDSDGIVPDLVFRDTPPYAIPPNFTREPITVGLGLMAFTDFRTGKVGSEIYADYITRMTKLATAILDKGCRIRLLIGESIDITARADLLSRVRKAGYDVESIVQHASIETFQDLYREILQTHFVVATRFHNVAAALLCLRPVISIGYTNKNDRLLIDAGLSAYCNYAKSFEVEAILRQMAELCAHAPAAIDGIFRQREKYRLALAELDEKLRQQLANAKAIAGGFV